MGFRKTSTSRARGGFTLVELLVVIAIIGILVSLLLPAVQAAREAARRMQCSNNLKQMGLAVHNYHDTHRCFPPGGITPGGTSSGPEGKSFINWAIAILPYIEKKPLYDLYDQNSYNEDPGLNDGNKIVRETLVPMYVCPSEPGGGWLGVPVGGPGGAMGVGLEYRAGSYLAVAGCIGNDQGLRDQGWWDMYLPTWPVPDRERRGVMHMTGVLDWTCEKMASVVDGTSNTLMIGEKSTSSRQDIAPYWAYPYIYHCMGHSIEHPLSITNDVETCMAMAAEAGVWVAPCTRSWGSFHPGVVQFAVVDGSVRAINTNVDLTVLCGISTVDGGEVTPMP